MKNTTKTLIISMLLLGIFGQVHAKNVNNQKGNHQANNQEHKRPPCFSSLDINDDSEISFGEFSSHKIPHGDHQTVFNTIDTDGNSFISHEEFVNHKPPHQQKHKDN